MKTIHILWTGGFDSTFRVLQLSKFPVVIQPCYLSDGRKSEDNELSSMRENQERILARPDTKCTFLPLRLIKVDSLTPRPDIEESYRSVCAVSPLGDQYRWLGFFTRDNPGVELSIHQDDKAVLAIHKLGGLQTIHDDMVGDYHVVDPERSSPDLVTLLGAYRIPLVYLTKLDMKKEYLRQGAEDVMNATWFCYTPVRGKPCGKCNPCFYTIEEGMKERFSTGAMLRHYIWKAGRPVKRAVKRVVRR